MNKLRIPDIIGIGFRRCASSWLHRCLNEHPDIGKTQTGIHYFSENLSKGDRWYLKQFLDSSDKRVMIDLSVSYSYPEYFEQVIPNMYQLAPQSRLFALVRNPVDRAYSDYRRSIFKEELASTFTFEQAIEKYPILLERGQYKRILSCFLDIYSQSQLKIFFYDDIQNSCQNFSG